MTNMPNSQFNIHLYNCADEAMQNAIIKTHHNFFTIDPDKLLDMVEALVTQRSNPIVHRLTFASMSQDEGEPIQNYLVRLRAVAVDCSFSFPLCEHDLSDIYNKDQITRGVANDALQAKSAWRPAPMNPFIGQGWTPQYVTPEQVGCFAQKLPESNKRANQPNIISWLAIPADCHGSLPCREPWVLSMCRWINRLADLISPKPQTSQCVKAYLDLPRHFSKLWCSWRTTITSFKGLKENWKYRKNNFSPKKYYKLYIYIYTFNEFPDFFVETFKIVVDSCKFTMLLLYILWDDWPIFMISGSNQQLQQG